MSDHSINGEDRTHDALLDRAIEAVRAEPLCEDSLRETLARVRVAELVRVPHQGQDGPATTRGTGILPVNPPRIRAKMALPRRWLVVASAAAVLVVAATAWLWHPRVSWAEVAKALEGKPWIHGISKVGDGPPNEFWLSPEQGVFADRGRGETRFVDSRLRMRYQYDPKDETIMRTVPNENESAQGLAAYFEGVMRGDMRIGSVFEGQEIVAQEERRVVDGGRKWLEYELTTRIANDLASDRLFRARFRLDPETHLPQSMAMWEVGKTGPVGQKIDCVFDYPDQGPRDIYDLGVPRTARLIDRVPTADLSQLYAAVEAGRNRFDSYFGIVVRQKKEEPWYVGDLEGIVWRKGVRWRFEIGMFKQRPPKPQGDVDPATWWKEQLDGCVFWPVEVCDGHTVYHCNQGRWSEARTIEPKRGLQVDGQAAAGMPEMTAYPVGLEDKKHLFTTRLEREPKDGPADSLLLHYEATDAVRHAGAFRDLRYRIDPAKGFITLEEWMAGARDPDGSTTTVIRTLEDLQRSPRGIWYPTLVREKVTRTPTDGAPKETESVTRFFLDFQAKLPDDLFRPVDRE